MACTASLIRKLLWSLPMDINLERVGDKVYCTNTENCIDMTGVDEDIFWETAKEEVMEIYKNTEFDLHINGFRV